MAAEHAAEPGKACPLCSRLVGYRASNAATHADWFNGAVPSFGDPRARLLVVGLAPGVQGANRTGRPFTGDYAGVLLYNTLAKFGFVQGTYDARPDDGVELRDAMITNAVRCAPPENKPTPAEIASCRPFLAARLSSLPRLRAVVCLGRIAHDSTVVALGLRKAATVFAHGARHRADGLTLFDSYHCSRYNTNTGRLTEAMFEDVFAAVRGHLDGARPID
ncbi:MAG: uracil-DNA glycosylase [Parvularculaceae bacterium]|jgi:uracil-DNA glycosylase family 4|nr:uracil-DNA glycosylase [Parvularculaceae bacterium]